jgi:hypothetical protein
MALTSGVGGLKEAHCKVELRDLNWQPRQLNIPPICPAGSRSNPFQHLSSQEKKVVDEEHMEEGKCGMYNVGILIWQLRDQTEYMYDYFYRHVGKRGRY